MAPNAVATILTLSRSLAAKIPGVSEKMIWAPGRWHTPRMRVRVVWGLLEMIETFCPRMWLSRVDLPALGAPAMAT